MWDTGKGLTIKGVYSSGYLMLAVSAVLTLILASLWDKRDFFDQLDTWTARRCNNLCKPVTDN